jgi:alginate O-acetyltransferase complex protein AlgI
MDSLRPAQPTQPAAAPRAPHRRFLPAATPTGPEPTAETGLYRGEPSACRRDWRKFVPALAPLALLVAVFRAYQLEGRAFLLLAEVALAAFPIHYLLPYRWKKPFFLAATIVGLGRVFGPSVAASVLALGAVLIGICYLPIAWKARAGLLAAVALTMALGRGGLAGLPVPTLVWPVLASMFMFRMIIYLYELKHAKAREPLLDTVNYFLLLPNWCFMHFPVVDYRTFRRGYFSKDVHALQRTGLSMMLRGTIHLLLYRLIYHKLLIPAEEVHSLGTLAAFLACNYLLYLRVSGQFHMACGLLQLFGYGLPETHHHYLLATGFTDYWRRINIYWKDFMVCLRGSWGFTVPDALFWGILGGLVMVNVQLDARSSRKKRSLTPNAQAFSVGALAVRSAKTAGTLLTIMLLWSLWASPSVAAWVGMLRRGLGV